MNKRNLIIGIVVLVALVGAVVLWQQKSNQQNTNQEEQRITKQGQEQNSKINNIQEKNSEKTTNLFDLDYKNELKINVLQYNTKQEIGWDLLAFNSSKAFKQKIDYKVDILNTIVYKKDKYFIGGYIFRKTHSSIPSDRICDSIFITVCESRSGWCDVSKSFAIDVCSRTDKYKKITDESIREIIDLLIEREYPEK